MSIYLILALALGLGALGLGLVLGKFMSPRRRFRRPPTTAVPTPTTPGATPAPAIPATPIPGATPVWKLVMWYSVLIISTSKAGIWARNPDNQRWMIQHVALVVAIVLAAIAAFRTWFLLEDVLVLIWNREWPETRHASPEACVWIWFWAVLTWALYKYKPWAEGTKKEPLLTWRLVRHLVSRLGSHFVQIALVIAGVIMGWFLLLDVLSAVWYQGWPTDGHSNPWGVVFVWVAFFVVKAISNRLELGEPKANRRPPTRQDLTPPIFRHDGSHH